MLVDIDRYPSTRIALSAIDPQRNIMNWVQGLTSKRFLEELAHDRHGMKRDAARKAAEVASGHVEMACHFMEQALSSVPIVSFLPLYYACLNFAKAYVAFGPLRSLLPKQRRHGLEYNPHEKNSRHLLTERIRVYPEGVFPLLYQSITKLPPPQKHWKILRTVYPYMSNVGVEFSMITGKEELCAPCQFGASKDGSRWRLRCHVSTPIPGRSTRWYKAIRGFQRRPEYDVESSEAFESGPFSCDSESDIAIKGGEQVQRFLLHHSITPSGEHVPVPSTPISASNMVLPEEIPWFIALFHMSCVTRYKPDFAQQLMNSQYWPLLLALRSEGFYQIPLMFWEYMARECVHFRQPG